MEKIFHEIEKVKVFNCFISKIRQTFPIRSSYLGCRSSYSLDSAVVKFLQLGFSTKKLPTSLLPIANSTQLSNLPFVMTESWLRENTSLPDSCRTVLSGVQPSSSGYLRVYSCRGNSPNALDMGPDDHRNLDLDQEHSCPIKTFV